MIRTDLGIATAYAEAVSKGYTGTRDEFGQMFADFGKTAEKVTEDKKAVEQMKLSVEETKNSVDTTAAEFGQNVVDMTAEATASITEHANTEKESATAAISEAKDAATGAITEAQTSATDAIASAKDSATAEITKKGTDTLATIPEDYTALTGQVSSLKENKVDKPFAADDGKIPRAKEGGVEWVDVGQPTDEQTNSAVSDWLNEHPEATTTVQDNSLTVNKFVKSKYSMIGCGANNSGIKDCSDVLRIIVNKIKEDFLESRHFDRANIIVFESGKYVFKEGVEIPPYCKIRVQGAVEIFSEVNGALFTLLRRTDDLSEID